MSQAINIYEIEIGIEENDFGIPEELIIDGDSLNQDVAVEVSQPETVVKPLTPAPEPVPEPVAVPEAPA